ncbi:hypothetical protein [Nonomuraea sp. SBT364]|uniref:hypothetical protein n=1 Tax=Nonomuraea sp. SBT364 TaxID=1580530 RepID=UPI00066A18E6|nr:hypothetical protein [Nonomuraea sp. SBT364]
MGDQYGIRIDGGTVNGPIAMGPNARATVHHAGAGEAGRLLDRLVRLLAEHEPSLAEPARARRDAADVRQELQEAEPDRGRVLDALKRLSVRAAEVTAIVEVVAQIQALFE